MLKIFAMGNLTSDIELRTNADTGKAFCQMRIASDRCYTGADGRRGVDFVSVRAYGRQAESCARYLHKGAKVFVSGELETREYEREGQSVTGFLIKAQDVEFLSLGKEPREE